MSDRDDELENLLKPLKNVAPTDMQMQHWKSAVKAELGRASLPRRPGRMLQFAQLVAAVFIGFVLGALVFHRQSPAVSGVTVVAENSSSNATFEYSHANLD